MRLVETALRCYPQRWRSRHGDEAAEIATLLIRDGTPARSVAWSYLMGAARMRLVIKPCRRVGAAVGALLLAIGSLGVPLALLSSSAPANAASVTHSRTTHPRPAGPRRSDSQPAGPRSAGPRSAGPRSAGPRYSDGRGAPGRCGQLDHC
jgi:hypothetical protein